MCDVGLTAGYDFKLDIPMRTEGGVFSGSGLTGQRDFRIHQINFSTRLQTFIPGEWNITLSTQKINLDHLTVVTYNARIYYHTKGWHIEVEYLYKHYAKEAFGTVYSADVFANCDIPSKRCSFFKISPLVHFDYMADHSGGHRYANSVRGETGVLIVDGYEHPRLTDSVTLSVGKSLISDFHVNYEECLYEYNNLAKVSEKDRFAIKVMARF